MIKRILVPVDFSKPSQQALDYAIEFRRRHKAELIVLHVMEPVAYQMAGDMYGLGYDAGIMYRELERSAREQLSRLATKLRTRRVAARMLFRFGTAHQLIVESAKKLKADLIIMSTHGRTGLSHVLMGSVAEKVVRTAACPVLTVRGLGPGARRRARVTQRVQRRSAPGSARSH